MGSMLIDLANVLFGRGATAWKENYADLHIKLKQARIHLPLDLYISKTLLFALLAGLIVEILGFGFALSWIKLIEFTAIDIGKGAAAGLIETHLHTLILFFIAIICFLISAEIVYGIFIMYPGIRANIRKSQIDNTLPHATSYLYALSRSGMNLLELFKSIGSFEYIYGTTSREISYIVRDMEYFGYDLLAALSNASNYTPSEKLKDFFDGLISILTSGGNLVMYMKNKSEQYHFIASQEQERFLRTLGAMAEVYITAFVAGPLFIMTILLVLGIIGGGSVNMLYILIYLFIPFASLVFIIFIETLSSAPAEVPDIIILEKEINVFKDVPLVVSESDEKKMFWHFRFYRKLSQIKDDLLHPIRTLEKQPAKILLASVPAGILFFLFSTDFRRPQMPGNTGQWIELAAQFDKTIFFSLLIILIPFVIFFELRLRWIRKIEDQIPEFLKRLASINEAGISLTDAIVIATESNIGILKKEIKRVANDIQWGTITSNALKKMEYRIRTITIARIITLLVKASESAGDIKNVLFIASNTADMEKRLKDERRTDMFIYVFVIYITFFVFLFIVYTLTVSFLPAIPKQTIGAENFMSLSVGLNVDEYIHLFFHAALIQGFCSGIIAGQMGEGLIFSGLKHSIVMMSIAYLIFTLFI